MSKPVMTILQLYPRDMNIYGDNGNVLMLKRWLEWSGITPRIVAYNPGDTIPENVDIVIGGGGQDSGQDKIQEDLLAIGPKLCALAEAGTPMLVICGLYQLFGRFFETQDGARINGIGLFDIETYGKPERLTGNILTHSEEFGDIIGYENHSGQTFLFDGTEPLAQVTFGAGNNTADGHEGARKYNVIGSYLHGPLLPKNPHIAGFLIHTAWQRRSPETVPPEVRRPGVDGLAEEARRVAASRPR